MGDPPTPTLPWSQGSCVPSNGACKQDGQSVDDYLVRLGQMWEELHSYKSIRDCCCDAVKSIEKEKEDERVYQFLMGLDDVMKTKIDFILMGKAPLPTLIQAYSLIVKEEEHIQAAQSKGHKHVSCSHCGRKGHEVKGCFALIGYPEERQRNKSTNTRGRHGRRASSSGKSTNTQGRFNASDQTNQSFKSPGPSQTVVTNQSLKSPSPSQTAVTNQSLKSPGPSQTAVTNKSLRSPALMDTDKFKDFLKLRARQDPKSNIYPTAPSASDSKQILMAQKLEAKGGNGGKEWDDGADYEGVSQIYIREGRGGIECIKFDYVKNEQPKAGPIHGGYDHSFTEWFDLNHTCDEHIVSVKCYFDEGAIQGLVIKTNIRTSAYMGYDVGTTFKLEVKGKKIIGFHGSSDKLLYSLGAYFAPLSPANLKH